MHTIAQAQSHRSACGISTRLSARFRATHRSRVGDGGRGDLLGLRLGVTGVGGSPEGVSGHHGEGGCCSDHFQTELGASSGSRQRQAGLGVWNSVQVWKPAHALGVQGVERQGAVCGRVCVPSEGALWYAPFPLHDWFCLHLGCCGCCDAMWHCVARGCVREHIPYGMPRS